MPTKKKPTKQNKSFDADAFKAAGAKITDEAIKESLKLELSFDPMAITNIVLEFGKILTGLPLYGYQEKIAFRVIHSVITFEGAVLTVLISRQAGKSETMAFIIDTLTVLMPALGKYIPELEQFKGGFRIGLFAPQSDQVYTTYNRAMLRLTTENAEMVMNDEDLLVGFESEVRLELTNGSYLKGQVASIKSKIESKTYDLVIIEEAQDVDSYLVEKSIEPMVSATSGSILKVGTTGVSKNHYWHEIQMNRNKDRKIEDKRLCNHWEFDYKKVIADRRLQFEKDGKRFHLNYEQDIVRKKERMGEDSQSFKLSYALKWDLESGMMITDEDFEKITNKKKGLEVFDENDKMVAGLDIAKDVNSTVLTIGKVIDNEEDEFGNPKKEIVAWVELSGFDYEAQHHLILNALIEYNVSVMFADYTGVGKPVVDRLMYACGEYVHIEPYTFSRQSKSEMWYNFTSDIATKRFIVPANKKTKSTEEFKKFEEQMKNCTKTFEDSYLVCQKGDGYMDDYADSAALMCLAGNFNTAETYEIEQDEFNPLYGGIADARENVKRNSY